METEWQRNNRGGAKSTSEDEGFLVICPFCKEDMSSSLIPFNWLFCYCGDEVIYYYPSSQSWHIGAKLMTETEMARYMKLKAFW